MWIVDFIFTCSNSLCLARDSLCLERMATGIFCSGQSCSDVWTFSVYRWKSSGSISRSCLQNNQSISNFFFFRLFQKVARCRLAMVGGSRQYLPVDVGVANAAGKVLSCAAGRASVVEGLDV